GGGSALWVQSKEADRKLEVARRATELRQGVETDFQTVASLRDQARWPMGRQLLARARERLGDTGPADLHERLEQMTADLELAARLDAIRLRQATFVEGKFDYKTAEQDYAAAFAEAGVVVGQRDEEEAAARVRGSAIREQLVAALDDWAIVADDS